MPVMGIALAHYSLLILSSLADGDRHGYAIKKDIARRTDGEVNLGSTTLYRLLAQLLDDGLIVERPGAGLDDERRRPYRISATGKRTLEAELARLERMLIAARPASSRRVP